MARYLVTGVTGQIGWYCAKNLAEAGHKVFALVRGQRDPVLPPNVEMVRGDLLDSTSLITALRTHRPDAVFNFGALTAIGQSWGTPELMSEVTGLGVLRLLDAVRVVDKDIHVVQASSADQFGEMAWRMEAATEQTPFAPRSPYGVAKQFAHDMCVSYREAYGMHISTAIQFNVTSPRHGTEFVIPKVAKAVAEIKSHRQKTLTLGNLDVVRDWGYAGDTARAYPMIAEHHRPDDYVIATGVATSLEVLVWKAFLTVGLDWHNHVVQDAESLRRPADVLARVGNSGKIRDILGWEPTLTLDELIDVMVGHYLAESRRAEW